MPPKQAEPTGTERAALEAKRGLASCHRLYAVEGVEVRAAADPDSTLVDFVGHASVTGKGYDMYDGPEKGGWTEYVDRGAFKRTLGRNPDVAFLLNHTGLTMARTKAGSLTLREDSVGLEAKAQLNTARSDVKDVVIAMQDKNVDEMSFAFRVKADAWSDDDTERTLTEVSLHKGDVSVVNFGANPATSAQLNSAANALEVLASLDPEAAMAELRSGDGIDLGRLARARDNVLALHRQMKPAKTSGLMNLDAARAVQDGGVKVQLSPQIPAHRTGVCTEPGFDRRGAAAGAAGNRAVLRYMHAWVDPDGDPESPDSYRFPHHEPRIGSPANLPAVRHALSLLPQADMGADQKVAIERHLRRHLEDVG